MSTSLAQSLARTLNTRTSLESVDVDVNIGQDAIVDEDGAVTSPLAPLTDEPIAEAQQTELAEEEGEIVETEGDAEDTDSDIETLESIQIALESTLDKGGLDTVSYEMFGLTMDHIYRRYGIEANAVLPSMESFSDDAHAQTVVSMEKVKDTLKSVKEGAVQLIKKLWFHLKTFVANLFKFNLTVVKRAQALAKAAGELRDDKQRPDIKLFSAKYLMIGGKVADKGAAIQGFINNEVALKEISGVLNERIGEFAGLAERLADGEAAEKVDATLIAVTQKDIKAAGRLESFNDKMRFSNAKFVKTEFGSYKGKPIFTGVKLVTDKAPERGADSEGYKIKPLTCTEIVKVANHVVDMAEALKAFDKGHNKSNLEKIITNKLTKLDDNGEAIDVKLAGSVKKAIRYELSLHAKYLSYVSKVNKSMLDYCGQSLQAIKKDAK